MAARVIIFAKGVVVRLPMGIFKEKTIFLLSEW